MGQPGWHSLDYRKLDRNRDWLQIAPRDSNKDGKNEEINVNVRVAGIEPSSVRQILVLQTFSYGLSDQVNMQFKMPTYNVF